MQIRRALTAPAVLSALAALLISTPAVATEQRPFSVRDSIEMTQLNDPNGSMLRANDIELSPDGNWFLLVTRKGNLETGANDFTLWLYDAQAVRASLTTPDLPKAKSIARFSSMSNRNGISQVRWMKDSRTVAFLGEAPDKPAQLYTVDIRTGKIAGLTAHPTPLIDFDLQLGADRFVYMAEAPLDTRQRERGYETGTTHMLDVMSGNERLMPRAAFFIGNRKGTARAVALPPQRYGGSHGLWLSPSGRHAVVPRLVAGAGLSWWKDYAAVDRPPFNKANDPAVWGFATENPAVFLQYTLVDTATGAARPLFDAPTGFLFGGRSLAVHWAADENSVVLANTFLPLQGVNDPEERARRAASPSVAELDLRSFTIRRIVDLLAPIQAEHGPAPIRPFAGMHVTAGGDVVVTWANPDRSEHKTAYRKDAEGWSEVAMDRARARATPTLAVSVTQGLNQPPELAATESATGRSKIITDLNPQLRQMTLGKAEVLEWTGPDGKPWKGGLLKPIGWEAGKRYPLVVQTHGFDPSVFLVDGPFGSPSGYAARALANRGIMVLQAQDAPPPYGVPQEPANGLDGILAAIDLLDSQGLIDRQRVGIHGFSRSGLVVQQALVSPRLRFAAASVADANALGVMTYLWGFGNGYPAMMDNEWLIGAPLWGDENARRWTERDPVFHLDRVHTPLRIDAYSAPTYFDTYAILRRHQKPVEYWAYPASTHNPLKPWQRLTTQGGTVDWYDFWLNGHEDPDPAKAAQYVRWRKLREQHQADLAALPEPPSRP